MTYFCDFVGNLPLNWEPVATHGINLHKSNNNETENKKAQNSFYKVMKRRYIVNTSINLNLIS